MGRQISFVATPLVWLVTAATLLAQPDPLSVIPDDSLGLVIVNRLADSSTRVQQLTQKMQLPVPDLLPMAQLLTGVQAGLDTKGGLAAAAFPDDREDATWGMSLAVFVPVSDYRAFLAQLKPADADAPITEVTVQGEQYLAAKKGDFAVLCASEQKHVLEHVLSSSTNVAAKVEPIRAWLGEQQAAVVITPAGKTMLFAKLRGFVDEGLKAFESEDADADAAKKGDAPTTPEAQSIKQLLESGKELATAAESQLAQLGVGLRIDEQTSLHASAHVLFTPQEQLSRWAASVKVPQGGLLAGLPAIKFVIAYGGVTADLNPAINKLLDRFVETGLERLGLSDELRKKYAAAIARQRANQLHTCGLIGQLRPGDSIATTAIALERVKDAKQHLTLTRDVLEVLRLASAKGEETKKPVYALNDVTIGDSKALEIVTDMNAIFSGTTPDAAMAAQMQGFFSKLFGEEGVIRVYMTVADDRTVVSAYSKELLERGVEHVRSGAAGLEADPQIAHTAALLPQGAQWAAYVSPQGLLQWIDTLMRQVLPAAMNLKIPPFPPSDPIGFAAKVSEVGLDAEVVLPDSVVAGIGQHVGMLQQMMQGGAAPLP